MPAKVRVYELARELGMENKEIIDLCGSLGIGVKSHSSSVVEPQADRVRRKAEREGLVKEPKPEVKEEPKKVAKPAKPKKSKSVGKDDKDSDDKDSSGTPKKTKPVAKVEKPAAEKLAKPKAKGPVVSSARPKRPVSAPPSTPQGSIVRPAERLPARVAQPTPVAEQKVSAPVKPTAPKEPAKSAVPQEPVKAPAAKEVAAGKAPAAKPVPKSEGKTSAKPKQAAAPKPPAGAPPGPPRGRAGKPIPPPPGGGKIPPPPGNKGPSGRSGGGNNYRSGPSRSNTGSPSSPGRFSGPRSGGNARPSGGGNFKTMPGSGGPSGPPSGRGGPPGRGGPNRGPNRGGPNRGRSRRRSRRNRDMEELAPINAAPSYSAEDAPVPEGTVVIERASTAQDLGPALNRTAADVVRFLLTNGEMVTATQSLSDEMITSFAEDVGAEIRLVNPGEEQEVELQKLLQFEDDGDVDEAALTHRPPVITVMGHVDHGKTKLLDSIRSANVIDGEAGGITQHIGAYQVDRDGKKITFLDTPGHEAFTAMRARGASSTDIVVLVVAADDGVMPQTVEALDHAKAAEVPIVVAINKIDREGADIQKVMTQLSERGLVPEEWGGETIMSPVSAMTRDGIDDLLDSLLLVAEVEDLKAEETGRASGAVLESNLDIGRGPVATVLVSKGTLNVGDPLVAGAAWGRVRALVNDKGENVTQALPSTPVQVLGLNEVAEAGDSFVIAPSEKVAAKVASTREHWQRMSSFGRGGSSASAASGAKLEDLFKQIQAGEAATLNLVMKADVNGSLEAVCDSLKKLERPQAKLSFVLRGVGGITANDVQLAAASNATIIGFNVRPDKKARDLAAQEGVEIRNYEIIYKLIEDIEKAMLGLLVPETEEVITGEAEVREIFKLPKIGSIAGCMVTSGVITRNSSVRFLREGTIIWKGDVKSLKRFKEDAKEVKAGFECGIGLSDFQDLKEGDTIETFVEKEIPVS